MTVTSTPQEAGMGPRRTLQLLLLAAAAVSLVLALSGVLGSTFILAGP